MALLDDLKVFYNLNEASGAAAVDSVGGLNLTDNNTVGTATGIGGAGLSRTFGGTNQFLSRASSAAFQTGDIDFSIAGWFYLDTLVQSCILIGKDIDSPASARDYTLDYNFGAGAFRFYINGGGGGLIVFSPASLSATTFYYVAAGHSAASDVLWISVDAASPTTAATSGAVPDSSASSPFEIGARAYSGAEGYMAGRGQYVGKWDRDIRTDLSTLYAGGAGLSYAGMGGGGGGNRRRRLLICG
jgi:hypothetical protein